MNQKVKDKIWIDESGAKVPVDYVSPGNRLKERNATALYKEAKAINERLVSFKKDLQDMCMAVFYKMAEEHKVDSEIKGNFIWYNFDRTIKIEVSINDRIDFDDLTIIASKQKLDEFFQENLSSKQEFLKELVTDAFTTKRGKPDVKKVMDLIKWEEKIKSPLFQDAIALIKSSIRRPSSKKYFRISEMLEDGSYQLIDLNFSSI